MPTLKDDLTPAGALVETEIGLCSTKVQGIRHALRPVPSTFRCRALLDTGAERTCVDEAVCQALQLDYQGMALVNIPSQQVGLAFGVKHDVDLTILHPSGNARHHLIVRDLAVIELALNNFDFQVLIGRDVLAHCRFLYDGMFDRFYLRF